MPSNRRILVADDHPLTREGLSLAARAAIAGVSVFGVGTIAEAATQLKRWRDCRMILLDLLLPDAHGFTGLLTLQSLMPRTPIVVISAREDVALVEAAKALGAAAYLFKSSPLDAVAGHLRAVDRGAVVFSRTGEGGSGTAELQKRIATLSRAQHGVLMALADGRSNKQIAYDLSVTEATIKAHLTAVFRKLGVTNRSQALLAMRSVLAPVAAADRHPPP